MIQTELITKIKRKTSLITVKCAGRATRVSLDLLLETTQCAYASLFEELTSTQVLDRNWCIYMPQQEVGVFRLDQE